MINKAGEKIDRSGTPNKIFRRLLNFKPILKYN